jgi:hypothetical protein
MYQLISVVVDKPPNYFLLEEVELALPLVVGIGASVFLRHEDDVLAHYSVQKVHHEPTQNDVGASGVTTTG